MNTDDYTKPECFHGQIQHLHTLIQAAAFSVCLKGGKSLRVLTQLILLELWNIKPSIFAFLSSGVNTFRGMTSSLKCKIMGYFIDIGREKQLIIQFYQIIPWVYKSKSSPPPQCPSFRTTKILCTALLAENFHMFSVRICRNLDLKFISFTPKVVTCPLFSPIKRSSN